jgi:hypothetical protein
VETRLDIGDSRSLERLIKQADVWRAAAFHRYDSIGQVIGVESARRGLMLEQEKTWRKKLQDIVLPANGASKALREATRYWREDYSRGVSNADHQLVPSSILDRFDEYATLLDDLVETIEGGLINTS